MEGGRQRHGDRASSTIPERLSFASDGRRASSGAPPRPSRPAGSTRRRVGEPGARVLSTTTSYGPPPRASTALREAELPGARVVRRAVGPSPAAPCTQVRSQLVQGHLGAYRLAVADDVEVRLAEVDDALARARRNVRVADVPLVGDGPVEDLRPARHSPGSSGIRSSIAASVRRTPSPVMLRQIGKSAAAMPHPVSCTRGRNGDRRHEASSLATKSGYERSRSLTTAITPGHAISNAGSSKRTPRSLRGVELR